MSLNASPEDNVGVGTEASYDSTGKRKRFRRLFSRFAEKTSMVGVPWIYSARFWWAKVIWTILLLAALAAMTLHLWYLLSQYYSYPKTTTISLGFDKLRFPQVTICNTNVIHKGRLDKYDGASDLKELVNDLDPENLVPEMFDPNNTQLPTTINPKTTLSIDRTGTNVRRKRAVDDNYNKLNTSKYDDNYTNLDDTFSDEYFDNPMDEQTQLLQIFKDLYMEIDKSDRQDLGHDIDDMLNGCTFSSRTCNSSMFKLHQTSDYGNCYTISSKKFISIKSGPEGGLSLVLFLETDEYLDGITTGYGIRVHIQDQDTYPFPADEGIFVPAAMETDIGLKMLRIGRLGGNFGKCEKGDDFKKLFNLTYTRRACQEFCRISSAIKTCKCFEDEWEEFPFDDQNLKPCRTETEQKCLFDLYERFLKGDLQCTCDNPCNELAYVKSISQRQWPTTAYARVLLDWVCDWSPTTCEKIKDDLSRIYLVNNNFLKLNIYFEDLNFEEITEKEQIEIQQLLSDVGGAIGLWIGLSILSLCEVLQLIVELFYYCTHRGILEKQKLNTKNKKRESDIKHGDSEKKTRIPSKNSDKPSSKQFNDIRDIGYSRIYSHNGSQYNQPQNSYFQHVPERSSKGSQYDRSRYYRERGYNSDSHDPSIYIF